MFWGYAKNILGGLLLAGGLLAGTMGMSQEVRAAEPFASTPDQAQYQEAVDVLGDVEEYYVDALQVQMSLPSDWTVKVDEAGSDGYLTATTPVGESYIYTDELDADLCAEIENLSEASEELKQKAMDAKKDYIFTQPVTIEGEPEADLVEFHGVTYVAIKYDASGFGNHFTQWDFMTIIDGRDINIENFAANVLTDQAREEAYSLFKAVAEGTLFGSQEMVSAAAEEMRADVGAVGEVAADNTQKTSFLQKKVSANWLWIFLILPVLALIFGLKVSPKGEWQEDFLSLPISKGLLGICAVLIVLHHLSQQLAEAAGPMMFLEDIGVCFVGMFFFFSGYGLYKSFQEKPDYLRGFLGKRLPSIVIPFYVCTWIFVIEELALKTSFSTGELIAYITGWFLINSHMWYLIEIAVLYIAFFLIFRFIKKDSTALLVMGIFVALMTVGSLLLGHGPFWFQGEWWFNTSMLFVVGMVICRFEKPVAAFVKGHYPLMLIGMGILTSALGFLTKFMLDNVSYWSEYAYSDGRMAYGDKFLCLSVQLPFVICFVLFMLTLTMKVQFKNKVMDFLGKISLELYLIHNLFLQLFASNVKINNSVCYVVIVLVCSIMAATIIHLLNQALIKLIKK